MIKTLCFGVIMLVSLITGCSIYYGPKSPYSLEYGDMFKNVQIPDSDTIQKNGMVWTFAKPADDVWKACMNVIVQYEGIISLDEKDYNDRRLIFIHGKEMQLKGPRGYKNFGMVFSKFLDTWLALSIKPQEGGKWTDVGISWISPVTREASSANRMTSIVQNNTKSSGDQKKPIYQHFNFESEGFKRHTISGYNDLISGLSEGNRELSEMILKKEEPSERWELVPQATINSFLFALGVQLFGPERWETKFAGLPDLNNRQFREIPPINFNQVDEEKKQLVLEAGNWMSAKMRRATPVINCPKTIEIFKGMIDRMKKPANQEHREVNVFVMASPEINAFAIPNGDILICSGLLEALDNQDEVAAVLAHELDHLFQYDTVGTLEKIVSAKHTQMAIMMVGAMAAGVGGAVVGLAAAGGAAGLATSTSSQVTADLVSNMTSQAIQSATGVVSISIGSAMISGYSQEKELRADSNGACYIHAAGYDAGAEIEVLKKLKEFKVGAEKRQEQISSGYINCEPGLDMRTEEIKKTIKNLKANSS